jgi:putative membrane protein
VLLPTLVGGKRPGDEPWQLAAVGVLTLLGFVSWLVTRWRIEQDDLRIETGVLRRQSLRYPLSQLQAVDIVRPGLARMLGVAELRLRMGGATGGAARLAYLHIREVEPLRARLLVLAAGARHDEARAEAGRPAPEHVLTTVPTVRLVASILISDVGLLAEGVLVALVVTAVLSPAAATGVLSGGAAWIISVATLVWRRFNQEYGLTLAESDAGLQLRSGLVALTSETIRPGRLQAVRMVEPLLWRRLGWCRLEVDLAGRQRRKGEGQAQRGQLRAVLPVGSLELAEELLDRLVPRRPRDLIRPPGRALWKTPLRFRMLAAGRSESCVATRSGRLRRVTCWVPLDKAQSIRWVQGPVQRSFGLATLHVDVAGRGVRAVLRDRDAHEAEFELATLPALARAARTRPTPPPAALPSPAG